MNLSVNDSFIKFDDENETNSQENEQLLETEGVQQKKRGRPLKRLLETKREKSNENAKKIKLTKEPYETRSRKIANISFI